MKKIEAVLIIILIIFFIEISNTYANSEISLNIESKEVNEDQFIVSINIENISKENKANGIKFDLFYNSNLFEVIDGGKAKSAGSAIDLYENYANEGRVRIGMVSLTGISQPGNLYEIKFKILNKSELKTNEEFKLKIKEISDSKGNELSAVTKDGTITFKNIENFPEENINQEKEIKKIIINIDDDDINEIDPNEDMNISLNDTSIKKQNVKTIINENKTDLDLENELTYDVENSEILSIDADGNIIPKQTGITNIIVKDIDGNEKIIPISIVSEEMQGTIEYKEYEENRENKIEDSSKIDDNNNNKLSNKKEELREIKKKVNIKFVLIVALSITIFAILFIIIKKHKKNNNKR